MNWSSKYAPLKLKDIVGQDGISLLVKAVSSWKKGKGILLFGPSGTGKTASVYAYAKEYGLDVVELNASDFRNAAGIQGVAGAASVQQSLFSRGKIILIDDLDGIAGNEDRGGVPAIVKLIESSRFPIVLTANEPSEKKISSIVKKCTQIAYPAISYTHIAALLSSICEKEKIIAETDAVKMLARIAEGDVRAAINDLQGLASEGKLTVKDVELLAGRDKTTPLAQALLRVFKTRDPQVAVASFDHLSEDIDDLFLWLEENIPVEYTKAADLARAMDAVAVADTFRGRIRRWQYYRFQVYCYALLSAGVAIAKDERYAGAHEYRPTSRLLKIWMANQKKAKKKDMALIMRSRMHGSVRSLVQDSLPYVRVMMKNKALSQELASYFKFDKEDVEWLKK
jgi:replication factor C large subunit